MSGSKWAVVRGNAAADVGSLRHTAGAAFDAASAGLVFACQIQQVTLVQKREEMLEAAASIVEGQLYAEYASEGHFLVLASAAGKLFASDCAAAEKLVVATAAANLNAERFQEVHRLSLRDFDIDSVG